MSESERWIVIPNWPELQHYKERDPAWVKLYTRLLHKDEYLALTYRQRGILHGIWMLYAASDGRISAGGGGEVGSMLAQLGTKPGQKPVGSRDLEALNEAGFITFSASRPLALRYQRASPETEREKNTKAVTSKADADNGPGAIRHFRTFIAEHLRMAP